MNTILLPYCDRCKCIFIRDSFYGFVTVLKVEYMEGYGVSIYNLEIYNARLVF